MMASSAHLTCCCCSVRGARAEDAAKEQQLIEKALGHDFDGFDRTIDVHILNLRRKLEPDPSHPSYIKTVYGTGYKLLEVSSDT